MRISARYNEEQSDSDEVNNKKRGTRSRPVKEEVDEDS